MSKSKSVIPEFMVDNPTDIFKILFPLRLRLDDEEYSQSHFDVVVKNITKKEVFLYEMSPELLFTHYPLEKSFLKGDKTKYYTNKDITEKSFLIDTTHLAESNTLHLHKILDEKSIVSLIGWKRKFLKEAKYNYCYLFKQDNVNIIIPHYAVAIYFYYRFTHLREAVLKCKLDDLYSGCCCDRDDASIVLRYPRIDADAAFIHRYACQSDATYAFEDVAKYIHSYLKFMHDNYPEKEDIKTVPIKVKFPIKEIFKIETRAALLKNDDTNEEFYYVHEITNDYSDIGFDKFTKYYEKDKVITDIDELENLPKVDIENPDETTEILKVEAASKKNTQTQHQKEKRKTCGSLQGIEIESETVTKETIIDLFKIYEEHQSDEAVDQSLTESSTKGKKKIRKVVVSSNFEKEQNESKPLSEIDNFVVFRQYMDFLKIQKEIISFYLSEVKELPKVTIKDTEDINSKCMMHGRPRQYLTATFIYKNFHVGILELENYPSSASSSWILVSEQKILDSDFHIFIARHFKDLEAINTMKKQDKESSIKFTTKNHERNENLTDNEKFKWVVGLIGKIFL